MASVSFNVPVNMYAAGVWYGYVTNASASNITITGSGGFSSSYDGHFVYSNNNLAGGTVTGFREYANYSLAYSVNGLSLDALTVKGYLDSGNAIGLVQYAANGDDVFSGSTGDDVIDGFNGNDAVYGNGGNDALYGNVGSDWLLGGGGNDYLDGGTGADSAQFSGSRSQYTISKAGSGFTVSDSIGGRDGFDTVANVERLHFSDYQVGLDISGISGQAYRIYQAAFDRAPDLGGLGFWINAMDHGTSLTQVAGAFISSQEFASTYGALGNSQFATQLYENVLHRAPDTGGLSYWTSVLDSGALSRSDVLVGFSESAENQAAVVGAIQNGVTFLL